MAANISSMVSYVGLQPLLTAVACSLFIAWYIRTFWMSVSPELPPGPPRIPSPFHILFATLMARKGLQPLLDLNKKYGDMVYIHFGNRPSLLISSYGLVKELVIQLADHTSGRVPIPAVDQVVEYDKGGIFFSNGDAWIHNRRFALKALRQMGLGKRSLETKVNTEAAMLCDVFSAKCGMPFNAHPLVYNAVSNNICSITFGHRYEYSDPKFKKIVSFLRNLGSDNIGFFLDLPLIFFRKIRTELLQVKAHIAEEITFHMKNFDVNDLRDMLDMFLNEIERLKSMGGKSSLSLESFWSSIFDLFIAGTDSVATTLMWGFLVLSDYTEIQTRLAAEINEVIGPDRRPTYKDRENMPYTQAFILELLRFRPVACIGAPHMVTTDLRVRGYCIPKGTEITINIYGIHHDPKIWGDPAIFRPERFLSDDGTAVVTRPELIPFGAGRRVCLGEQLAKLELFLFLSNLLQRFTFQLPDGRAANYSFGSRLPIISPDPYDIIIKER